MWPVDRVRIELDTCTRPGWYELDAVQARGGVLDLGNVLNATDKLYLSAAPGMASAPPCKPHSWSQRPTPPAMP